MNKEKAPGPAPAKHEIDQRLVRKLGRAMWRVSEEQTGGLTQATRTAAWEQARKEWAAKARKVLRVLESDGVDLKMSDTQER